MILLVGLVGCAATDVDGEPTAAEPRPYVMQYAAVYYGGPDSRSFDWLELRRDGTFTAMVDGAVHDGRYDEQETASREPALEFSGETDTFVGTLHADWASGHRLAVSRGGVAEVLTTTSVGSEAMCEASGGTWRDDDADTAGLYCSCALGRKYIPSAGGCTD